MKDGREEERQEKCISYHDDGIENRMQVGGESNDCCWLGERLLQRSAVKQKQAAGVESNERSPPLSCSTSWGYEGQDGALAGRWEESRSRPSYKLARPTNSKCFIRSSSKMSPLGGNVLFIYYSSQYMHKICHTRQKLLIVMKIIVLEHSAST